MVLMTFRSWWHSHSFVTLKDKKKLSQWTYLVGEAFLKVEISLNRSTRRIQEIGHTRSIARIGEEENFLCPFRCIWLPYQSWFLSHCRKNSEMKQGVKKAKQEFIYAIVFSQGESKHSQVSSCPELFGNLVMQGITMKTWNIHGGDRRLWDLIPWFSPQLQLPKRRKDFCPYLDLIGSALASMHVGYFLSARLTLM